MTSPVRTGKAVVGVVAIQTEGLGVSEVAMPLAYPTRASWNRSVATARAVAS